MPSEIARATRRRERRGALPRDAEHPSASRLLVSIRGVSPDVGQGLDDLWVLCLGHGVRPTLVVALPPVSRLATGVACRFRDWLLARIDQGARILLNAGPSECGDRLGTPIAPSPSPPLASGRSRRAAGEGCDCGGCEAAARDASVLSQWGCAPLGIVSPAAQARPCLLRTARNNGWALAEDARGVHVVGVGTVLEAPLLQWSDALQTTNPRSHRSPTLQGVARQTPPSMRVALQPSDVQHPAERRALEWCLDRIRMAGDADGYGVVLRGTRSAGDTSPRADASGTRPRAPMAKDAA